MSAITWSTDRIEPRPVRFGHAPQRRARPDKPLRRAPIMPVTPVGPAHPDRLRHPPHRPTNRSTDARPDAGSGLYRAGDTADQRDHELRAGAGPVPTPTRRRASGRLALAAAAGLLLPGSMHTPGPDASAPSVAEAAARQASGELIALRSRYDRLQVELDTARALSSELAIERDTLSDDNARLNAEIDALIVETTDLNRELLALDLALVAAAQERLDAAPRQTVYNFVNVPIGSRAPLPLPPSTAVASLAPRLADTAAPPPRAADPEPAAGAELIASFYRDVQNGVPNEQLLESLDDLGESGLVTGEDIHAMYQELMYRWDEESR